MSAKPKKKVITFGMFKNKECTVTRKKPSIDGYVVVNIVQGPTVEIHKDYIK